MGFWPPFADMVVSTTFILLDHLQSLDLLSYDDDYKIALTEWGNTFVRACIPDGLPLSGNEDQRPAAFKNSGT